MKQLTEAQLDGLLTLAWMKGFDASKESFNATTVSADARLEYNRDMICADDVEAVAKMV